MKKWTKAIISEWHECVKQVHGSVISKIFIPNLKCSTAFYYNYALLCNIGRDAWSGWYPWQECRGSSCIDGIQIRTRVCLNHMLEGQPCKGQSYKQRQCITRKCKLLNLLSCIGAMGEFHRLIMIANCLRPL